MTELEAQVEVFRAWLRSLQVRKNELLEEARKKDNSRIYDIVKTERAEVDGIIINFERMCPAPKSSAALNTTVSAQAPTSTKPNAASSMTMPTGRRGCYVGPAENSLEARLSPLVKQGYRLVDVREPGRPPRSSAKK